MESNTHQSFQSQPSNSGLLRFRSAPSSLLLSCTDAAGKGSSGECFETERLISRFIGDDSFSPEFGEKPVAAVTEAEGYGGDRRGWLGLPPHYPRVSSTEGCFGFVGASAKPVGPVSGLARQNSSPAGLFSQFSAQNGFNGSNVELSPSTKRLKSHLSLSSLGMLSQISEIGEETVEDAIDGKLGYHWNDPLHFATMKREEEDDRDAFFSNSQNGDVGGRVGVLSHHLSLPRTSAEMLQYQDSVPCKIRAKRGCATHPRSIAERVRRTRISERMRKLQDLVPNMDKQTNTSDMLDLAVDYIKDLQQQYKNLSDSRANCKCMNLHSMIANRTI